MPPASFFTCLMTEVVMRNDRKRWYSSEKKRLFCTLGFQVRRLLRWLKEIWLPNWMCLPPYRPRKRRFIVGRCRTQVVSGVSSDADVDVALCGAAGRGSSKHAARRSIFVLPRLGAKGKACLRLLGFFAGLCGNLFSGVGIRKSPNN